MRRVLDAKQQAGACRGNDQRGIVPSREITIRAIDLSGIGALLEEGGQCLVSHLWPLLEVSPADGWKAQRFADAEARLLMPDGTRVILYQVPSGSGIRYLNGLMELRGKGMDLELTREQTAVRLACKAYEIPKKE